MMHAPLLVKVAAEQRRVADRNVRLTATKPAWREALAFLLLAAGAAQAESQLSTSHDAVFAKTVAPFLQQHCFKCHSAEAEKAGKLKGKFRVDTIPAQGAPERWKAVAEQLAMGDMPPEKEPRPAAHAVERVLAWLGGEMAKAGLDLSAVEAKRQLPQHANRVDHDLLFSGTVNLPAASPPRLWRMSPFLYSGFIRKVTGSKSDDKASRVAQAFAMSSTPGFKDYSGLFAIDEPTISQLMRNAEQIVEMQTRRGAGGKLAKEFELLLNEQQPPARQEIEAAVRSQFRMALLREPSGEETQRFVAFAQKTMQEAGQVPGAKAMLATILMQPEALYRFELGDGRVDAHGRQMLAPREIAYAVSFALTDEPPRDALLRAAQDGKLATREEVRREVERLLDDPQIRKPRIMRFFEEYFEFPAAHDVFKDVKRGQWRPEVLVNDTRQLIEHLLAADRDVLRELLTTRKSFVNYAIDAQKKTARPAREVKKRQPKKDKKTGEMIPPPPREELAIHDHYNLPRDWEWVAEQPLELPEERAGVLTQPSWLAAFATNDENDPIRRGKWIRERLLGDVIPDLPITVNAQLPHAPEQTLRRRMEITKEEYCWQCHRKMNPVGLPFEMFDYLGRHRTSEPVVDLEATAKNVDRKGASLGPVLRPADLDTTGVLEGSGDPRLEGSITDAVQLVRKLADSPRVRQVFVRHAFRYWMGRNEALSDSSTLIAADRAYVESGGSMKALIAALLTSDSFLYRSVPKAAEHGFEPVSTPSHLPRTTKPNPSSVNFPKEPL